MARVEIPIVVLNSTTGLPISSASVAISNRATGGPVTWYTTEGGGVGSTSALVTDSNGRVNGWVPRGAYNLTVSGTGITTYTEPWDALPASDGGGDSLWLPDGVVTGPKIASSQVGLSHLADDTTSLVFHKTLAALGTTDTTTLGSSWQTTGISFTRTLAVGDVVMLWGSAYVEGGGAGGNSSAKVDALWGLTRPDSTVLAIGVPGRVIANFTGAVSVPVVARYAALAAGSHNFTLFGTNAGPGGGGRVLGSLSYATCLLFKSESA